MHAIFFGLKRAFQSTLRRTWPWCDTVGLTPARFDMLWGLRGARYGMAQSNLRRMLGVSRTTVSRMVRALEQKALVHRRRSERDKRQLRVTITRLGRLLVKRLHRFFIKSGEARRAIVRALVDEKHWRNEGVWLVAMDEAESVFRRLRDGFGDIADLHYPWHPDD